MSFSPLLTCGLDLRWHRISPNITLYRHMTFLSYATLEVTKIQIVSQGLHCLHITLYVKSLRERKWFTWCNLEARSIRRHKDKGIRQSRLTLTANGACFLLDRKWVLFDSKWTLLQKTKGNLWGETVMLKRRRCMSLRPGHYPLELLCPWRFR